LRGRQIGRSYIIKDVGIELYGNYVEINFVENDVGNMILIPFGIFIQIHYCPVKAGKSVFEIVET